ncbi:terminase large subunit [Luteolibacter yonseiensis]|uniref:terminase large subunit n=1 Tax=Luteolibacter yonseiensis TaxID=1144680 RepID=UPI002D7EABB4|nr:terminase TerL endonuclease subunit [Luteolibacter yonseiensis]
MRLACERHRRDLARSKSKDFPYRFDPQKANRKCKFDELLPHTKGKWARKDPVTRQPQTIRLEGWQKFILCSVFGWVKKTTGTRRFRKGRIYVPRKNGKSIFGAAIGLYMLSMDDEPGAEVYSGATSEKQALEVFKPAHRMCQIDPELADWMGVTVTAQQLIREDDAAKFQPVIGKPGDGTSPHCGIVDEFHEHKTSELIDTFETGMGARSQPLSLVISTAGANLAGPCREDWKLCERILEGLEGFEDETTFAIIFTIDEGDAWDDIESLKKANPNYGVSIEEDFLLAELQSARQNPSKQARFKTKHLNQWVSSKDGFFNVATWQSLEKKITREQFKEFPCYLSGDLSSKHDLTVQMQLFCLDNSRYAVFGRYWITEAALDLPENQHYRKWHLAGKLEVAGQDIIDLEPFMDAAEEACREYEVLEMPSDPNRAWGVYPMMEARGVPMVEYRNTVLMMSEPMKLLDALIRAGHIQHDGDPVLTWAISNTTGKLDHKDNVFPNKDAPANKIDPVVSLIMALGRAMTRTEAAGSFFSF